MPASLVHCLCEDEREKRGRHRGVSCGNRFWVELPDCDISLTLIGDFGDTARNSQTQSHPGVLRLLASVVEVVDIKKPPRSSFGSLGSNAGVVVLAVSIPQRANSTESAEPSPTFNSPISPYERTLRDPLQASTPTLERATRGLLSPRAKPIEPCPSMEVCPLGRSKSG